MALTPTRPLPADSGHRLIDFEMGLGPVAAEVVIDVHDDQRRPLAEALRAPKPAAATPPVARGEVNTGSKLVPCLSIAVSPVMFGAPG